MKPYLLVTGDFVKTGGMDRANYALADYLARQGYDLHLVAYQADPELLAYNNITFHQVHKVANSYLLSAPLLDRIGRFHAQRISQCGGRVIVNGGNCQWADINWVHYVHAVYEPSFQTGKLQQIKGKLSRWNCLYAERQALQSAPIIIVNSEKTKKDLIKNLAIPDERIHCVYYGIDPQLFYPATPDERAKLRQRLGWPKDKLMVVFIGALGDRRKGFDTLFSAWQQLCTYSDWDADLVAIGVGAELPQWQQRAEAAGISSRIRFLGFRCDVPNLLQTADCLVAPTRYEAYGLGVHEALCCGLPALVSTTAGVAERYPSHVKDLLLPAPDDAMELAAQLYRWRRNSSQYSQWINTLSEELRSYTWDDMAKRIIEKIEKS